MTRYKYHVFLSHNGAQKDWTRQLAEKLRENSLSVFFDEDSIKLGDDVPIAIENGLKRSRHVVLVLSPEALTSRWVAFEYSASLYKDPNAARRTLIPVLRKDCEIPLTLARLNYLDARSDDFDRQVKHLLSAIEKVKIGKSKSVSKKPKATVQIKPPSHDIGIEQRLSLSSPVHPQSEAFYVERDVDLRIRRIIERSGTAVIYGPRKIGKTSLVIRACDYAKKLGYPVALIDFQMFQTGSSLPQLYYSIATKLSAELKLDKPDPEKFLLSPSVVFFDFLTNLPENTLLAFDEFDVLQGVNALSDFASLLRSLHNHRAVDSSAKYSIIISSWLDPFNYIQNKFVSPFNVGEILRMTNFNRAETESLIRNTLSTLSAKDADKIYNLIGGQPWLLQNSIYLISQGVTVNNLIKDAPSYFASYLDFLKISLSPETIKLLKQQELANLGDEILWALEKVGLIKLDHGKYIFTCELYKNVFS